MTKVADRVLERLRGTDAPLRTRGVALAVDAALELPLATFLDVERTTAIVLAGTTGENAARWVARHGWPGFERNLARYEGTNTTPADLLGPDARAQIERLAANVPRPTSAWAKNAVDPQLVRELLAPVWQETLTRFAKRLPVPGIGGGGDAGRGFGSGLGLRYKLKSRVEGRAAELVERSKTVLGGLGAEVERQVQAAAREFSQSATQTAKEAFDARMQSEDGKRLVGEIRKQALAAVLDTPIATLQEDARAFPVRAWMDLAPLIADHQRGLPAYRALLSEEVGAIVAADGLRPIRELLAEAGLLDLVTTNLLTDLDVVAAATVETDTFARWVHDLVKP